MQLQHGDWVMVGDGAKALFLHNQGDETYPNLQTVDVLEHDHAATRDMGTDRPGRAFSSSSDRRSAYEQTDWHQLEETRFAGDIAGKLLKAAQKGRYSRLVVVAPPRALGDLRKAFHKEVSGRIVAEVDKDLTMFPSHEIERALQEMD